MSKRCNYGFYHWWLVALSHLQLQWLMSSIGSKKLNSFKNPKNNHRDISMYSVSIRKKTRRKNQLQLGTFKISTQTKLSKKKYIFDLIKLILSKNIPRKYKAHQASDITFKLRLSWEITTPIFSRHWYLRKYLWLF